MGTARGNGDGEGEWDGEWEWDGEGDRDGELHESSQGEARFQSLLEA
jgi:hypothetical protein